MTELLYLQDSYLKEFDATVVTAEGAAVVLNRTAFYPGGGGQPADGGRLSWNGVSVSVGEMQRAGSEAVHVVDGTPPAAGAAVRGVIDWERRYAIMRHHTALHVLVGVIYKVFAAKVTGGAIYPDRARMDFSLEDLNKERVAAIEQEANRIIAQGHRILVRYVPRDEYQRSDLTRLANVVLPPEITEVRVIDIEGFDAQADGGTHVANTLEIGSLVITKTENKGKTNRRLEIALLPDEQANKRASEQE
ncbi:MAG TPA: alanyl-tRNA editing protein [bacterium]|jgi:misacylated tRNA(Ala) deacylase